MTQKFYAIVTNLGAAKIANAVSLGTKLNITQMAVGDGGGTLPTPNASQTKLVNEVRRAALNSLTVDENNSSQIIAEQVIPETEGGFWIREMGLFDADGVLIAVANCAETYKPQLQEGSGRTQTMRMIIIVSSTDAVTLKVDPAVVLATRKYVDDALIVVRGYADNLLAAHLKSSDPHTQYAPKASPTLTGTPKAPTPATTKNDTQIATTAFAQALMQAHVADSDPHTQYLPKTQLSSATDSNSEEQAATPKAVKAANDNANARVPQTRRINGRELSRDIDVTAADVGALPSNGTAVAASKLATARTINGVAFDGSANITISASGIGSYTKAESDARYQRDTRLGARNYRSWSGGAMYEIAGNVITGLQSDGGVDGTNDYIVMRPLQKLVNGTWYTVAQV